MRTQNLHDDFVEQVRSSSDILSVISSYVHLKKRGNRYWGCCPFHNEKTPSFSVVPQQGFFIALVVMLVVIYLNLYLL